MATGSLIIDVAEAVKDAIAAGAFSQKFTPVRLWLVSWSLQEIGELRVAVVPASLNLQDVSRGKTSRQVVVDIGIHKRVDNVTTTAVDPYVMLTEELLCFFIPKRGEVRQLDVAAPNSFRASCISAELIDGAQAAISPELLKERRAYAAVIRTTWQVL